MELQHNDMMSYWYQLNFLIPNILEISSNNPMCISGILRVEILPNCKTKTKKHFVWEMQWRFEGKSDWNYWLKVLYLRGLGTIFHPKLGPEMTEKWLFSMFLLQFCRFSFTWFGFLKSLSFWSISNENTGNTLCG